MGNIMCLQGRGEKNQGFAWDISGNWDLKTVPLVDEFHITEAELILVKKKWYLLTCEKTLRSFAYTLFEKLFVSFPDRNKLLFVADSGAFISSQQWKEHALFAQHIREIVGSLGTIIEFLDKEESLREYLQNLEEFHRSLRGMKKFYVEIFIRIIDEAMASHFAEPYAGDTKRVFRKVLTMIYFRLTWRLLV